MDPRPMSTVHVYTTLNSRAVSSFSRSDAALYKEMTSFRLNGCGYLPVIYADTSSHPSDIPRATNRDFISHQQRMSIILSELERSRPFDSDLMETSRAKSIAWAQDHMQVLEQFKVLSWKIHEAKQKQEAATVRADGLARETQRLNDLVDRVLFVQGFALCGVILSVLGIMYTGVTRYLPF
ncbi:hypothetical protein CVT26_000556 [Gymnopilus dilepis]|uniref:Uncharacterized protein n=1 Tax=Gymnopilus dilepis TaxID=231916 RepID=A0A409WL07_9AGAR|nr:hypothetical protein CVT26_000556 [Gymnopilus dilepis]